MSARDSRVPLKTLAQLRLLNGGRLGDSTQSVRVGGLPATKLSVHVHVNRVAGPSEHKVAW